MLRIFDKWTALFEYQIKKIILENTCENCLILDSHSGLGVWDWKKEILSLVSKHKIGRNKVSFSSQKLKKASRWALLSMSTCSIFGQNQLDLNSQLRVHHNSFLRNLQKLFSLVWKAATCSIYCDCYRDREYHFFAMWRFIRNIQFSKMAQAVASIWSRVTETDRVLKDVSSAQHFWFGCTILKPPLISILGVTFNLKA